LQRCLQKDPKQRLRDIGDARIAIEEILSGRVEPGAGPPTAAAPARPAAPLWRRTLPWIAGPILGIGLAAAIFFFFFRAEKPAATHFRAVTNFPGVQAQPALSPDGRSVAFVSNRDGHYNIYIGLVAGGNLVQVTSDPSLKARPRWSPDGTTLVYGRLNDSGIWDVWQAPALGGTPRRLILNAKDPSWSPDGQWLAYTNTSTRSIWISNASSQNARQITSPASDWLEHVEPSFSPDGREIAFLVRSRGPYGTMEVVEVASGRIRQLTRDFALSLSPAWSSDGRHLYFASSRGGTVNIWKIPAVGGQPEQITSGQGDDAQLDVSSDGKRIVFSTFRENSRIAQSELDKAAGPQTPKPLTNDPGRDQVAPAYSPDGKRIAYFSNLKGVEREGIWISNADGSAPSQLVQDEHFNIFPRWNSDSEHLIYCSQTAVSAGEVKSEYRSVDVLGGAPRTILNGAQDLYFDVGPDGRLLFRDSGDEIQSFDAANNKTLGIFKFPDGKHSGLERWSPDGKLMAYIESPSQENDPNAGIWVTDFKAPPRQIFRGWVVFFARGPNNQIYALEGKADLIGMLWQVGWDGQGLRRNAATIPLAYSYWILIELEAQAYFDISPDGKHLAFDSQGVLQANIGMIENVR
jgi:Tol biopolymer transport system component